MDGVKLEGGRRVEKHVRAIVDAGIVVVGHIGLTPQSYRQLGGFRVQGMNTSSSSQSLHHHRSNDQDIFHHSSLID